MEAQEARSIASAPARQSEKPKGRQPFLPGTSPEEHGSHFPWERRLSRLESPRFPPPHCSAVCPRSRPAGHCPRQARPPPRHPHHLARGYVEVADERDTFLAPERHPRDSAPQLSPSAVLVPGPAEDPPTRPVAAFRHPSLNLTAMRAYALLSYAWPHGRHSDNPTCVYDITVCVAVPRDSCW